MRLSKITGFLIIGFLLAGQIAAGDMGFVTLGNKYQAEVVSNILDHAYTREGNRFLVSLDNIQKQTLTRAGIEFEIIVENFDPTTYYIIRPNDNYIPDLYDINQLGRFHDLGFGVKLAGLSSMAAADISDNHNYAVTSIEEMNIRFLYLPPTFSTSLLGINDFPTDSIANLVSQDSIYAMNRRLELFETRYIFSDSIDAARDWIVQKFLDWGYTNVTTPTFYYGNDTHYNVVAVKQGYAEPDKVIVIGGHYDSVVYSQPQGPLIFAPGSDDDGSGTAITLEMARILKDIPTRKTIIFIPFSAEEVGLVGSRAAAANFVNTNTVVEVMFNYDMVGYEPDGIWELNLSSGPNTAYRDLSIAAATRLTSITPIVQAMGGSSDHYSFYEQGFNICNNIEGTFNQAGWHTNLDLTSRMNFPYMADVARMAAAALGIVANSAYPTEISELLDMGDGQSITLSWDDCFSEYAYIVVYGTSSGAYTDTIEVTPGLCSQTVTGLVEGATYYFSVVSIVTGGYPAVYVKELSGESLVYPRKPTNFKTDPALLSIILNWSPNLEADISHYRIYRDDGDGYVLYQDNFTNTSFTDNAVEKYTTYLYKITAVDNDMNESVESDEKNSVPASFDRGILVVDEMAHEFPLPDQVGQQAYISDLFQGTPFDLFEVNPFQEPLNRIVAGQYSSIFWIDDDPTSKLIANSEDTLDWFTIASLPTNILICGMQTLSYWSYSTVPFDHMLKQRFDINSYSPNNNFDFAGAFGHNGFPSVTIDPSNAFGNLPYVTKLDVGPSAQVIYTFDSFTDNPAFEGEPCAVLYDSPNGKRILLGFPLYYLTDASARSLINHVTILFGENGEYTSGDVNNSGEVDISDLLYLVDYMFTLDSPAPLNMNSADVDGSCQVDISDLLRLVDYMFLPPEETPELLPGCYY